MPHEKTPREGNPYFVRSLDEAAEKLECNVPYVIVKEETILKIFGLLQIIAKATGTFESVDQAIADIADANGLTPGFIKSKVITEDCRHCPLEGCVNRLNPFEG